MILTKEFVEKLKCEDAEPWISANNFWGKTTDELLDALEISNPIFFAQAVIAIPSIISSEIVQKNDFTLTDVYLVNSIHYQDFESAKNAVRSEQLKMFLERRNDFYVNKIIVNESGDEAWSIIDIDSINEEGIFAVFNPITGVYTKENSLEKTKELLQNTKDYVINNIYVPIYRKIIDNSTQEEAFVIQEK